MEQSGRDAKAGGEATVAVLVEPAEMTGLQPPDHGSADHGTADREVLDELLVEEVSIDGMCGVY